MELNQLIHEGQEYILGLANTECYVTTLTRQLLQEDDCPASKLGCLRVQIQQADARMQLGKAILLVKKENRNKVDLLKKQMEQLVQQSIAELKDVVSYEHSKSLEAKEMHAPIGTQETTTSNGSSDLSFQKYAATNSKSRQPRLY
jgi:hypothetical protein